MPLGTPLLPPGKTPAVLRSVLAAALTTTTITLLAIAGPADTLAAVGKEHDAFIVAAEREVAAMPFLRAYAYQDAAHEFCFSDVNFPALAATAMLQAGGAKTSLMKEAEQQAAAHLSGDQNACGSGHCLREGDGVEGGGRAGAAHHRSTPARKSQEKLGAAMFNADEVAAVLNKDKAHGFKR